MGQRATLGVVAVQVGVGRGGARTVPGMVGGQGRVGAPGSVVEVVAVAAAAAAVVTLLWAIAPTPQATATAAWHHAPKAGLGTRCGRG